MRHWRTTGNGNVAIQNGRTYISDSMSWQISLQFRRQTRSLRPGKSWQKVSYSDHNIVRQPEIAIGPSKPEIVIPLELQQIASKFQQQVPDFRPWWARIKCRQLIATIYRQPEMAMWPSKPEILIYLELQQIGWQFQRQIRGFDDAHLEETAPSYCDNGRQPKMAI